MSQILGATSVKHGQPLPLPNSGLPRVRPLIDVVRALGADLYLNGVQFCTRCLKPMGSPRCTCHPDRTPNRRRATR